MVVNKTGMERNSSRTNHYVPNYLITVLMSDTKGRQVAVGMYCRETSQSLGFGAVSALKTSLKI